MTVHILSIHDATPDGNFLAVDLEDIIAALGDAVERHQFAILDIEVVAPEGAELYRRVREAKDTGLWLSASELRDLAAGIEQTIEGQIVAYPLGVELAELSKGDRQLAAFPVNKMAFAIVDSSYFELYLKDEQLADRVAARFRDVRREDPATFFGPRR